MDLEKSLYSDVISIEYSLKTDYKKLYFESGINLAYNLQEYNSGKYK